MQIYNNPLSGTIACEQLNIKINKCNFASFSIIIYHKCFKDEIRLLSIIEGVGRTPLKSEQISQKEIGHWTG